MERAKNRPFHCNICGKGFATESSLRTHTSKVSWTYIWFNVVILEFQLKMQPKCNFLWNAIYFFYLKRFQSNHAKHFQWNEAPLFIRHFIKNQKFIRHFNENVETNHISNKSVITFRKSLTKISAALIFRPCMIPESQNKWNSIFYLLVREEYKFKRYSSQHKSDKNMKMHENLIKV